MPTNSNTLNENETPSRGEAPEGLTSQQARAAELIAAGLDYGEVAGELGVGRTTLWRWRQRASFQAYLNRLHMEASEHVRERLQGLRAQALDALEEVMAGGNPALALQAAQAVLKAAAAEEASPADPRALLRERAKAETFQFVEGLRTLGGLYDWRDRYRELCQEEGIDP